MRRNGGTRRVVIDEYRKEKKKGILRKEEKENVKVSNVLKLVERNGVTERSAFCRIPNQPHGRLFAARESRWIRGMVTSEEIILDD